MVAQRGADFGATGERQRKVRVANARSRGAAPRSRRRRAESSASTTSTRWRPCPRRWRRCRPRCRAAVLDDPQLSTKRPQGVRRRAPRSRRRSPNCIRPKSDGSNWRCCGRKSRGSRIASEAKQSSARVSAQHKPRHLLQTQTGLPRRYAPRNDDFAPPTSPRPSPPPRRWRSTPAAGSRRSGASQSSISPATNVPGICVSMKCSSSASNGDAARRRDRARDRRDAGELRTAA